MGSECAPCESHERPCHLSRLRLYQWHQRWGASGEHADGQAGVVHQHLQGHLPRQRILGTRGTMAKHYDWTRVYGKVVGNIYVHGGYKPTHISLRNHLEGGTFAYRICRKSQAQRTCEEQVLSLSHDHCRALVFLDYVYIYIYIIMLYIYLLTHVSVSGRPCLWKAEKASRKGTSHPDPWFPQVIH
jgi:hypothetical protein